MTPDVAEGLTAGRPAMGGRWLMALPPFVLLAGLLGLVVWSGPADAVRGEGFPPVEQLTFQRVKLGPAGISATVLNDGPDPVTIAQVQVDEAYWSFAASSGTVLNHLGQTTLTIPYPWVQGETHIVRIVTSSGVTFDHEVAVAVETPRPDLRSFLVFTVIGIYVGVIPVAIGLLWFPLVSRLGRTGLDFLLALTIGQRPSYRSRFKAFSCSCSARWARFSGSKRSGGGSAAGPGRRARPAAGLGGCWRCWWPSGLDSIISGKGWPSARRLRWVRRPLARCSLSASRFTIRPRV